jgi:hypothetical protein
MERGGRLISWDMNGSKATFIRTVASETLERLHGKAISSHWTFVQASTSCPYTGTGIIGELTDRVNFSHHDSDHTWSTISGEVGHLLPYFQDGGIICVDDANQIYQSTYEPIINMTRRKLGLDSIPEIEGNRGKPHCDRIPELIGKYFGKMKDVTEGFEEKLSEDLYYQWYAVDRQKMNQVGMERMKQLVDRFVAYQIEGKL